MSVQPTEAVAAALLSCCLTKPASAQDAQASLGASASLSAHERSRDRTSAVALRSSLRADLSFDALLPSGPRWGGMLEASYLARRGARAMLGGGLYSRFEPFALIVTAGPSWDFADSNLGASLRLFFGSRPYNALSGYTAAGGLTLGYDYHTGNHAVFAGLHVDVTWLALPFVGIASWLRGPPKPYVSAR